MRYHNITKDDMLNGEGLRVVLWVAGCSHNCPECHNPVTWDIRGGIPFDQAAKDELFEELKKDYVSGVTLSGGDPLHPDNREETGRLMDSLKRLYPAVHDKLMREGSVRNREELRAMLRQGIADGLFIGSIDIDLAISVLYYTASALVSRRDLLLPEGISERKAFVQIVSTFFRGISTAEGLRLVDAYRARYE